MNLKKESGYTSRDLFPVLAVILIITICAIALSNIWKAKEVASANNVMSAETEGTTLANPIQLEGTVTVTVTQVVRKPEWATDEEFLQSMTDHELWIDKLGLPIGTTFVELHEFLSEHRLPDWVTETELHGFLHNEWHTKLLDEFPLSEWATDEELSGLLAEAELHWSVHNEQRDVTN